MPNGTYASGHCLVEKSLHLDLSDNTQDYCNEVGMAQVTGSQEYRTRGYRQGLFSTIVRGESVGTIQEVA